MRALMELCLIPNAGEISLSPYIAACEKLLEERGLKCELHAYGTNIEGDWDELFDAVKACHELVHEMGAVRIMSVIKVSTRTDREQTLEDKVVSVQTKL